MRQKFADEPVTVHDECGGEVERLISAPTFQFKGTGWYVTDYGKGGKVPARDSNGKHETKAEGAKAESPKTETKTKAEPKPATT